MSVASECSSRGDTPMNTFESILQWGPHRGPHPGPHAPMGPTGGAGAGMPWGAWGTGGDLLLTLVVLLLLAVLLVAAVYALSSRRQRASRDDTEVLSVLRRRYARGDIDDEEFDRKRTRLEEPTS